jgi:hypothetical protein
MIAPLPIRPLTAYMKSVGQPTIAINAAWNRRYGPGGGTRRLHHFRPASLGTAFGDEIGSTCVIKTQFSPGMVPPLSG